MTDDKNLDDKKDYYQSKNDAENEGKKSLKRKRKERQIRKKRKKLNSLKRMLRFLFFIGMVILIYEFVLYSGWYLAPDSFKKPGNNSVQIVNNKLTPQSIIYNSLSGIKIHKTPIFMMRVSPIKKAILKIPVVKSVYIRRYGLPARLLIIVRERVPMVVIKTDLSKQPVAFVTTDGVMVKDKNFMANAQNNETLVILVKNKNLDKEWNSKKIEYIEKIAKSVETYSDERVEYIDMRNPNDVFVKIETTNIRLGVLDSTVFERVKRIYTILPQIDGVDGTIKYIDLSWDKVNYLKMQNKEEQNKPKPENDKKKNELQ